MISVTERIRQHRTRFLPCGATLFISSLLVLNFASHCIMLVLSYPTRERPKVLRCVGRVTQRVPRVSFHNPVVPCGSLVSFRKANPLSAALVVFDSC